MILAHHTDAVLIARRDDVNASPGARVDAEYLLPLPAEHRGSVAGLARVITNRSPGYRYSDGLYAATRVYTNGGIEAVTARLHRDR